MSFWTALMSGKAIGVAVASGVLLLGAESMLVPRAMDRSYDRLTAEPALYIPSEPLSHEEIKQPSRPRYIPLSPIRTHEQDDGDTAPVS